MSMPSPWPALDYEAWSATCDTLHAHTQVLGKLAAELAPPEPQLQHAALRLTARGWETLPLPAPDGSGALVVALDLHAHEAVAEHSDGRAQRVALTPDRPVGAVTRELLEAVRGLGGAGRDRPDAAGGAVERPARRGRRARHLRPRPGGLLLRRRDPGRPRARRLPRALPRALDAGQRLVGILRPRGEPLLGPPRRPAVRRLHHAQRDGRAGGRRRLVAGRHALREGRLLRLRAPGARGLRRRDALGAGAGTQRSASTSWTGTTSSPPRTRAPSRSSSPARPSATRAWSAGGAPSSRPAPRARRRPWSELVSGSSAGRPRTGTTRCRRPRAASAGRA